MWLLLLVLLLIVLSVLFGGFQKGTKDNGLGYSANVVTVVASWEAAGSAGGTSG